MEKVYRFLYSQYGRDFRLSDRVRSIWMYFGMLGLLEKYLKWKTADLLAAVWRSERPPPPSFLTLGLSDVPLCLLGTDFRFWKQRLRSRSPTSKHVQLAFALNQGKAAGLPVSDDFVRAAVSSCVERLCSDEDIVEEVTVDGTTVTVADLRREISRTVEEIYGHGRQERGTPGSRRAASVKSSVESSRSRGGPHQFLSTQLSTVRGSEFLVGVAARGHRIVWIHAPGHPEDWEDTLWDSRSRAITCQGDRIPAYPVGLTEPFKVRTITRGAVDPYQLARRWQPSLWKPLQRHECSRLVGEPVSSGVITSFLGKCDPEDGRFFVSGDYEAATDYLNPELSEHCLEEVCHRLGVPPEETLVLLKCLPRHELIDPVTKETLGVQRRGQLMGSPISFPVLTILNLAFTRYSLELGACPENPLSTARPLDDHEILVNGDDVLFRAHPWEYRYWKAVVALGGLRPSLGKNQVSRRYFTINSELWHAILQPESELFPYTWFKSERLRFPQMGLAFGSVKGGCSELEEQPLFSQGAPAAASSRTSCWREFLQDAPIPSLAWDMLWDLSSSLRSQVPKGMAYCLPEWLGGLGLPLPPKGHPLREQRMAGSASLALARYIRDNWDTRTVRSWWRGRAYGGNSPAYLEYADEQLHRALHSLKVLPEPVPIDQDPDRYPLPLSSFFPIGVFSYEYCTKADKEEDMGKRLANLSKSWTRLLYRAWGSKTLPLHGSEIEYNPPKTFLSTRWITC
ncbi:RNA-dependent RNA polymerase [Wenling narna-like virus 1]|uniref:RNA-dependent RNA polymerase n=1 Tax=Wenling narna-like virus 1 TaxID=1923501 RepID=UPI00090AEB27|nr:RNA-dependent RNA polymerase [Wenling narna-like virus 1]APG77268.1 RNA-dependent RNA polymerase [Wenling narna-like virus 1]